MSLNFIAQINKKRNIYNIKYAVGGSCTDVME